MSDLFGQYRSQQTIGLQRIDSTKYPDTNKDFEANIRRLNGFVDYISQYLQQMQKGVDQANQDPITRLRDFAMDLGVLLGGGQLLYGIDLGDLQYYLPALGALFGFDSDQPFPLNLFYAAEHFLLGYIVPLDSFGFVIQDIINEWAAALGINEEYMAALNELLDELNAVGANLWDIIHTLLKIFDIFGVIFSEETGTDLFANIWHVISTLLGGLSLSDFGEITDPLFEAIAPWVHDLSIIVGWVNDILKAFANGEEGVIDGILNFAAIFSGLDLLGTTDPLGDFVEWISNILSVSLSGIIDILGKVIPIGALTDETMSVIWEGGFDTADTIPTGFGFTWDGTDGETTPYGCAVATGNTTTKAIYSNVFDVSPNQILRWRVAAKYSGVSNSGADAVLLELIPYNSANVAGAAVKVAGFQPSGTVADWSTVITGDYTVPMSGWKKAAARITVTSLINTGTLKFDNASVSRVQKIAQEWVEGLIDALANIIDWIENLVDRLLDAIGLTGTGGLLEKIEDLASGIGDWLLGTEDTASGLSNLIDDLLTVPNTVLGALHDVVYDTGQTIGDVFANADDAIADVFDDVRDGWTQFWNGIFKTPSDTTLRTAAQVQEAATSISVAVDSVTSNTETLASTILIPRTKSLWESKWPQDDVAFPVFNIDGYTAPTLGRLYLVPITASVDREYQSLKFAIQGTSMTNCYVGVYTIDTATGQADLISNLGDVKSQLSGATEQQSLALPDSISASKGQTYYIGILQVGGTAANMKRSSLTDTMTDYPTSYPQFFGNIVTGTLSSLPSTIAASSITSSVRFWGALGYGISPPAPPNQYFADSYNRANGPLGSNYIARKNYNVGLVISSNTVTCGDTGSGVSSLVPKFTTNNQGVRVTLAESMSSPGDLVGIFLRASSSMMVGVMTGGSGSTKVPRIITCPGFDIGNNTFSNCTIRATSSNPFPGTPVASYMLQLEAVGNVYTVKWTNGGSGLVTFSWTDSGGIVPIGAGQREAAIATDGLSGALDNFEMYDI